MPAVGVEFNRFRSVAPIMAAEVAALVNETASGIEQDVKGRAPKSSAGASPDGGALSAPIITGNLRRSYHRTVADPKTGKIEAEVGNDPQVAPYAIYVEFGTYKMAARPHLRPSFEAARDRFLAALGVLMGSRI